MTDDTDQYLIIGIAGALGVVSIAYEKQITNAINTLQNGFIIILAGLTLTMPFLIFSYCTYRTIQKYRWSLSTPVKSWINEINIEELYKDEPDDKEFTDEQTALQNLPQITPERPAPQRPTMEMHIDIDKLLATPLHRTTDLIPEEIHVLKSNGYQNKEFVPLNEVRRQPFLIKECKPESLEHTFVVHSIAHLLKEQLENVQTFPTQKPDIIFVHNNQEYALEIETPYWLKKKHKRLLTKAKTNNKLYSDRWWIVTTQSAYARSFKKYAKVLTRNQIHNWLLELIPEATLPIE